MAGTGSEIGDAMTVLTILLAVTFAVLVGRNDGSPLVALAIRPLSSGQWWPPLVLVIATVAVPALGLHAVAETLREMFAAAAGTSGLGLAVLLLATIATLALSTMLGVPTSITLALVGASAGAQLALGASAGGRIGRVLLLAALGPIVAALLAFAVTRVQRVASGRNLERNIRWQYGLGFVATAIAYGANDGQKLLAVFALLWGVSAGVGATDPRVVVLVAVCFAIGMVWGLRRSARGLRQGVLHPKPYQVASTLWASAIAVLLGSLLAAPVSMTQSITGGLIGSAPPQEWRRVRWEQSRRVLLAWLWTLPAAGVAGWLLTLLAQAIA